jgi:hypothetical protein
VTEDIKNLMVGGFLALKELLGYQCAFRQDTAPNSDKIVVFIDFFHAWIWGPHPLVHPRSPPIPRRAGTSPDPEWDHASGDVHLVLRGLRGD